jgi:hypothetical protein
MKERIGPGASRAGTSPAADECCRFFRTHLSIRELGDRNVDQCRYDNATRHCRYHGAGEGGGLMPRQVCCKTGLIRTPTAGSVPSKKNR